MVSLNVLSGKFVLTLLTFEYVVGSGRIFPFEAGELTSQSGPQTNSGVSLKKKSYSYVLSVFLHTGFI